MTRRRFETRDPLSPQTFAGTQQSRGGPVLVPVRCRGPGGLVEKPRAHMSVAAGSSIVRKVRRVRRRTRSGSQYDCPPRVLFMGHRQEKMAAGVAKKIKKSAGLPCGCGLGCLPDQLAGSAGKASLFRLCQPQNCGLPGIWDVKARLPLLLQHPINNDDSEPATNLR